MKNVAKMLSLGVVALLGAGMFLAGCQPGPELTKDQAQKLIQAKYDADPAAGFSIAVNDPGMLQGITAKYWERSKVYPANKLWADFTLTAEGKKVVKLPGGGDVIQWRPEVAKDLRYSIVVVTVAANHLKAREMSDPQDEVLPGVAAAKSVSFTEAVNLDGMPDALQNIAHNLGNKPSTRRQADFSLENGAWKLRAIN